jgi:hypothetical protein
VSKVGPPGFVCGSLCSFPRAARLLAGFFSPLETSLVPLDTQLPSCDSANNTKARLLGAQNAALPMHAELAAAYHSAGHHASHVPPLHSPPLSVLPALVSFLDFLACAAGATERAGATQGGARRTGVWAEPRGEGARGGENKNEIRAAAPPRGGRRGTEAV